MIFLVNCLNKYKVIVGVIFQIHCDGEMSVCPPLRSQLVCSLGGFKSTISYSRAHCSYLDIYISQKIRLCLKVSKSQNHFFLETPLPKKRTPYLTKFCSSFIGQNLSQYFVHFWAMEFQEKLLLRFTDL